MESKLWKSVASILGVLIVLYIGSYIWIRSTSFDFNDFGVWGSGATSPPSSNPVILLGFKDSDMSGGPKDADRLERKIKRIGTVFRPAVWIDEKVTGAKIFTSTEEIVEGF